MLYDLDAVIVIYAVEGNPADQQRALDHMAVLEQAGHRFAISDLTCTECLVPVFGPGGGFPAHLWTTWLSRRLGTLQLQLRTSIGSLKSTSHKVEGR